MRAESFVKVVGTYLIFHHFSKIVYIECQPLLPRAFPRDLCCLLVLFKEPVSSQQSDTKNNNYYYHTKSGALLFTKLLYPHAYLALETACCRGTLD